jgi:hypothetical protein
MTDSSHRNAWVDKYLEALLGDGLSKEYVNRIEDTETEDTYGTLAAQYWINLIIDDEQQNIVASWRKAKVRFWRMLARRCVLEWSYMKRHERSEHTRTGQWFRDHIVFQQQATLGSPFRGSALVDSRLRSSF